MHFNCTSLNKFLYKSYLNVDTNYLGHFIDYDLYYDLLDEYIISHICFPEQYLRDMQNSIEG